MQQQFLKYFENELEKIRNSLEDFEKLHPQKAKTLGISAGKSDDPNLQRLSDSFAFLAAGLSSQINQGYPKLAIDLMRLINPTTTIGTPGFCTVELGEHNQELPPTVKIKKGQEISVPISDGRECTFSIAHNTAIANLSISNLSFQAAPFTFGMPFEESEIKGALKFQLECNNSDEEISSLGISDIDFYLPQSSLRRNQLWKALTEDVAGISVTNPEDGKVFWLGSEKFFCKNIISDNNYLPELAVVGDGLEKLRDFLFYKEKFAFFSLDGVKDEFSLASTYKLEVRIFLKTQNTEPLVNVTEGDLKINVLPCINYFKRMSEPSEYSYARDRTTISPAKLARNEPIEVLKILDLYELSENGELKLPNMSSPDHSVQEDAVKWQELTELDQIDKSLATVSFSVFSDAIDSATTLQIVADVLCSNGDASSEPRSGNDNT